MSKFLLLLGPSGAGKSTIIQELRHQSPQIVYISPYMTRPLRPGETDKISVSDERMDEMVAAGQLVTVNTLFGGIRYGTPRAPIVQALRAGDYPVLDWPVKRMAIMHEAFPNQLYTVYIAPPSLKVLYTRISKDGRDTDGKRFEAAQHELESFWASEFASEIDLEVVSEDGNIPDIAQEILTCYHRSF